MALWIPSSHCLVMLCCSLLCAAHPYAFCLLVFGVDLQKYSLSNVLSIILHALHTDEEFGKSSVKGIIIIKCSDTDVLVFCVQYSPSMPPWPSGPRRRSLHQY